MFGIKIVHNLQFVSFCFYYYFPCSGETRFEHVFGIFGFISKGVVNAVETGNTIFPIGFYRKFQSKLFVHRHAQPQIGRPIRKTPAPAFARRQLGFAGFSVRKPMATTSAFRRATKTIFRFFTAVERGRNNNRTRPSRYARRAARFPEDFLEIVKFLRESGDGTI